MMHVEVVYLQRADKQEKSILFLQSLNKRKEFCVKEL